MKSITADPSGPRTIRLQPTPIDVFVTHFDTGSETVTTINRGWSPGDAGRCTRCVQCVARDDRCQMSIGADIPREQAADYSPRSVGAVFEAR